MSEKILNPLLAELEAAAGYCGCAYCRLPSGKKALGPPCCSGTVGRLLPADVRAALVRAALVARA